MSEPTSTATAVESGGGPPVEPPSIGGSGRETPFEGLDGKSYEGRPMPAGKPRSTRRRAAPGLTPTEAPDALQESAKPAGAPAPGQAPEPAARPTGLEALRRPGESDAEFYPRIHSEDRGRIQRIEREHQQLYSRSEAALREATAEIQRLRGLVEPMATRQQKEDERQRKEEEMARIPDRSDPEYLTLTAEAILQRQLAWEQEQRDLREQETKQAAERREQDELESYLADRDEGIQREIQEANAADPAFRQQLVAHLRLTERNVRQHDPNASDEEVEQAVYLLHLSEMVQAKKMGLSIAEYYAEQARQIREAAAMFGGAPANGNGHQPAAPAPSTPAAEAPAIGSPTAARVAREAGRSAVASGGPGRPGGATPGETRLPTQVYQSEDEYVRAGLRGQFDESWVKNALGKPVGERGSRRR